MNWDLLQNKLMEWKMDNHHHEFQFYKFQWLVDLLLIENYMK